jgi:heptosyltransferase-2
MNIAVRSPNWIGDCIMALPAVRALKKNLPDCNIYMVCKQYLCDIYKNIPEITQIVTIPDATDFKSLRRAARELKPLGFHRGILLTNSFGSALLFRMAGIKSLTGYVKDLRGLLLSRKLKFPGKADKKHHVYFYLDLVRAFVESIAGQSFAAEEWESAGGYSNELKIDEAERRAVSMKLGTMGIGPGRPWLGISPSAAYGTAKEWLPERFSQLVQRIKKELPDLELLFFGSAKEREKIDGIMQSLGNGYNLARNLAGQLSLREALAAISLCRAFISNDSGLMHVVSSFKLPLIALFGPTRPDKTAPLNTNSVVIHYPQACAPCLHRDCPYENHPCMSAISVDEVFQQLLSFLSKEGSDA